ncbi:hypothetical protein BDN71DRAFT_892484 [Pleurotus eryngii]|uniref:GIT Spa2 homology (SHD) domain-containing protein n=1 Tax=Pleurotus eryngii TaxID=5323 RepID=A0A9P6A0Q5_PLEER|nr:hypothetical protein BDN71DRAFT_892484 [Pleurotus eryngii]
MRLGGGQELKRNWLRRRVNVFKAPPSASSLRSPAYQVEKLSAADLVPTTTEFTEERAILQLRRDELGETLTGCLAPLVPGSQTKVRVPLEKLSTQQLLELSGDVYDEVVRRKYNLDTTVTRSLPITLTLSSGERPEHKGKRGA